MTETAEERAARKRLKELKKEAKKLETPERRAERRRRKKEIKSAAKREAREGGVVYVPAAYVSASGLQSNTVSYCFFY